MRKSLVQAFLQKEDSMAALVGFDPASSGQQPVDDVGNPISVGVWGDSSIGVGVFGTSGVPTPNLGNISIIGPAGVIGHSLTDTGVWGESIEGSGVIGRSQSNNNGVLGVTFSATANSAGVFGTSTVGGNGVIGFVGDAAGVIGNSVSGTGVEGITGTGNGVVGESVGLDGNPPAAGVLGRSDTFGVRGVSGPGTGVQGESVTGAGVKGVSTQEAGVRGVSTSSNGILGLSLGAASGVSGFQFSSEDGSGVFGESVVGAGVDGFSFSGIGVRGQGRDYAGMFLGRVLITGSLSKGGGGFAIDHPLDPETKYLRHSFVESPDMLNVYNGNITTDVNGEAHVTLPHYFQALNQDFRYQLTVIGQFAQAIVSQEIVNNCFTIKTDQPQVKVSWQVTGIRQDAWAAANRIAVEEEKAAEDKGRYLHPELHGLPMEAQIHGNQQHESQLHRVSQLAPEQLSLQIQRHLQARSRGDRADDGELQRLVGETRRLAGRYHRKEPPRIDHSHLQQEWQRVRELVQRLSPR
jgi:hypothetical protein